MIQVARFVFHAAFPFDFPCLQVFNIDPVEAIEHVENRLYNDRRCGDLCCL